MARPDGAGGARHDSQNVARAVASLVAAFGRHDKAAYFSHFAPDATFVFYNVDHVLGSRDDYERLWSEWEQADGFRIRSCSSANGRTRVFGDIAVVTHDVFTTTESRSGTTNLAERETIVLRRDGTRWLAVHEHLSPVVLSDNASQN
jgi:ketosteroid isomerase-like protein